MAASVFYAMPFSGFTFTEIVATRTALASRCEAHGLHLVEQFIGHEQEELFSWHGYLPSYIAAKDFGLIQESDIVIADFSSSSIGRDCEIVAACEIYRKPVIAIVPDSLQRQHPWIRLYSRNIVNNAEDAFALAAALGPWLAPAVDLMSVDLGLRHLCATDPERFVRLLPTELRTRWESLFAADYAFTIGQMAVGSVSTSVIPLHQHLATTGVDTNGLVVRDLTDLPKNLPHVHNGSDVLLCLPSSSDDGLFWAEPHRTLRWQLHNVVHHAVKQRELLIRSFDLMSDGQQLIYATHSLAPEENELVVDALLRLRPLASVIPFPDGLTQPCRIDKWGHIRCSDSHSHSLRIHPSADTNQGYFAARIRKQHSQ